MKKFAVIIFLLISCYFTKNAHAQSAKKTERDYQKKPYWIQMMDDPDANYFETVKAYTIYFENHAKPSEEEDIIGMRNATEQEKKNKKEWLKHLFSNRKEVSEQELAFEVKKFKFWCINTEPWVQDDGTILSSDKRLEILKSIRKP